MKLRLYKEFKALKSKGLFIRAETKKLGILTQRVEMISASLALEVSKYQELVVREGAALTKKDIMCKIESTLRRVYEEGLSRIVKEVESAVSDNVELIEIVRDMVQDYKEMTKVIHAE